MRPEDQQLIQSRMIKVISDLKKIQMRSDPRRLKRGYPMDQIVGELQLRRRGGVKLFPKLALAQVRFW